MEDVRFRVGQRASVLSHDAHQRVVYHDEPPRCPRERFEERCHRLSKADRGFEGRHEVGRECGVAWEWGWEIRSWQVMENDVRVSNRRSGLDLRVVER